MFVRSASLFILILLIASCGKGNQSNKYNPPLAPEYSPLFIQSDSEFVLFINEFSHQYSVYNGVSLSEEIPPINFYDLDSLPFLSNLAINISQHYNQSNSRMAGVCLSYPNGQREILIDAQIWDELDNSAGCNGSCFERKKALIFHELGHCVLDRTHKNNSVIDGSNIYYLSIMNSTLINQMDIVRWENDYFEELFTEDHSHLENIINSYIEN